jgi:deazaflavin-dependent oxidoreductase (nitroreductase family)
MLSGGMMLITVTGRKTGRRVTTPVQYLRDGNDLWITSTRQRTWWRNLRGGAEVNLRLRGKDVRGRGESIEAEPALAQGFQRYFQSAPHAAKYFGVKHDAAGRPRDEDIARLSHERVMIRICLEA